MSIARLIAVTATAALFASPALAAGPPADRGNPDKPAAKTTTPSGKAYGKHCQGQSKKHVKGEKGTAFSRCVHAMKLIATGKSKSPRKACAALSKKHVKGEKGTAYSRCVSAAAKLLKETKAAEQPAPTTTTPTS